MNIGIFDSGIGGISILHQAMLSLPKENYIFYADTDHVPYGTKSKEQIVDYVDHIMQFMIEYNCKAVVIACNTATAAAAQIMREKYQFPIIGIEPAVKPAVEQSAGKRVMVIATPLTIKEQKLKNLVDRIDDTHLVDLVPFPKLVQFAENGIFDTKEVEDYIRETLADYDMSQYGEFVLGCTHFNYFKDSYRKLFPENVRIIDGNEGTINQLKRVLESRGLLEENEGSVRYFTSGREVTDKEALNRIAALHVRLENMRSIT